MATNPGIRSQWQPMTPYRLLVGLGQSAPWCADRTGVSCGSYQLGQSMLNINAFATPAPFALGNTRLLPADRVCGSLNENIALYKNFDVTERIRVRFSGQFFNVFNRHQWGGLSTNINVPRSFGQYTATSGGRIGELALKIEF
jgi:hypothetical protein